jgi:formylglycine-generating enzyme required for sulfatase activity
LSSLKRLDVSSNRRIADVTPLAGLRRLEELNLSRTAVSDLGPLAELTSLRTLRIDELQPSAFATLAPAAGPQVFGTRLLPSLRGTPIAGQLFRECEECPVMVVIPDGEFMMGSAGREGQHSEQPFHKVTIRRRFAMGKYEVSFAEWDACIAGGGCSHAVNDWGQGRDSRPVAEMGWEGAQQFIAWLSGRTGAPYRLPSESEWEYAARAGANTRYPWGDEPGTNRANFRDSGSRWSAGMVAPVGRFEPNAFGLHDMIGNVMEWVQDCWNADYRGGPTDGAARETGDCSRRVVRGGAVNDESAIISSANRSGSLSGGEWLYTGFRVARTLR